MLYNINYLRYTYEHRQAFMFVLNKLKPMMSENTYGELLHHAKYHDLDKAFLYTLIPKKYASAYHKETASHHMENDMPKNEIDFIEAVIDYECAGYTKADKPRNAYDTILDLKPNHSDKLLKWCEKFGLNRHYLNTPNNPEWVAYKQTLVPPLDESIMQEIYEYIIFLYKPEAEKLMAYAQDKLLINCMEDD